MPSILSGRWPDEHRNWCYFVYDPQNFPFWTLRWLRWLPTAVTGRRIVRRWLTKFVKVQLNFRGYFDLYNIPFRYIHLFDFTEKKSPLQPKGMNRGPNIFDHLTEQKIPYFVTDPTTSEEANRDRLIGQLRTGEIDFGFVYWAGLDGLLHRVGNKSPEVPAKLRVYEEWIRSVLEAAKGQYSDVRLYIFSDHGMANCDELLELKAKIDPLGLEMGKDYAVVYDSTMARLGYEPTTLIIDIEGAEQFVDFRQVPASVKKIIIELHPAFIGFPATYQIIGELLKLGFRVEEETGGTYLFRRTVLPSWLGAIPLLALLIGFQFITLAPGGSVRGAMFIEGTIAGLVGAYGLWRFGLTPSERTSLTNKLGGRFRRGGATQGASTP